MRADRVNFNRLQISLKTIWIGLDLIITVKPEEYQLNGETKKAMRIKRLKASDGVVKAAVVSDNDGATDEIPF